MRHMRRFRGAATMTQPLSPADLDEIERLFENAPYCGDSGCHYGHRDKRGGQHTNGGCRCGNKFALPGSLDLYARCLHTALPKLISALRDSWREIENHKRTGRARDILGGGMAHGLLAADAEIDALRAKLAAAEKVAAAARFETRHHTHNLTPICRICEALSSFDAIGKGEK